MTTSILHTNTVHSPQHPLLTHPFFILILASSTCAFRCTELFLHLITLKDTHTLGRLLWTSDQPDTETSTWQQTTLTADRHPCPPPHGGIRTHIPRKQAAADPIFRPPGQLTYPQSVKNGSLQASTVVLSGRNIPTLKISPSRQHQYSQALNFPWTTPNMFAVLCTYHTATLHGQNEGSVPIIVRRNFVHYCLSRFKRN